MHQVGKRERKPPTPPSKEVHRIRIRLGAVEVLEIGYLLAINGKGITILEPSIETLR